MGSRFLKSKSKMRITIGVHQSIILRRLLKKQISDIERYKKRIMNCKCSIYTQDEDFRKSRINSENEEIKLLNDLLNQLNK